MEGLARSLPAAVERHPPHAVEFVPAGGVVREETLEHCCWYHGEPEAPLLVGGRQVDGRLEQGAETDRHFWGSKIAEARYPHHPGGRRTARSSIACRRRLINPWAGCESVRLLWAPVRRACLGGGLRHRPRLGGAPRSWGLSPGTTGNCPHP